MRKVREVLRLRFEVGCSQREIQASTGLSKGSVSEYLKRAASAGLAWETARSMTDADVEARLFRKDGTRPYQYSQFCDLYNAWRNTLASSMRQVHRAGEKLFVDYSGKKPRVADPVTGEVTEVDLFVAVLGASNYTYVEATRTQRKADFVGSTVRGGDRATGSDRARECSRRRLLSQGGYE